MLSRSMANLASCFLIVSVHPKIHMMQVCFSRTYSYLEIDLLKNLLTCLLIKKASREVFILRCTICASLIITGHKCLASRKTLPWIFIWKSWSDSESKSILEVSIPRYIISANMTKITYVENLSDPESKAGWSVYFPRSIIHESLVQVRLIVTWKRTCSKSFYPVIHLENLGYTQHLKQILVSIPRCSIYASLVQVEIIVTWEWTGSQNFNRDADANADANTKARGIA